MRNKITTDFNSIFSLYFHICGVEYAMYNNYPPPSVNRVNRVFVFVFRVATRGVHSILHAHSMTSSGWPRSTGFRADLGRAVALSDSTHLTQKTNAIPLLSGRSAWVDHTHVGAPSLVWTALLCGIPAGCSTRFPLLSATLPFSTPPFFRFFSAIHRCTLKTIFGTIHVSGNAYISIHIAELHKARLL